MINFFKKSRQMKENQEKEISIKNEQMKQIVEKEQIKAVLDTKKMPIVLLDPLWHTIRDTLVTSFIEEREKNLQELLKEQGKLNNELKQYTVVKQNLLKQILEVSDAIQENKLDGQVEKLDTLHKSVLATNEKITDIEQKIPEIEETIEKINKEIILEIILMGYEKIHVYKGQNKILEEEINILREQVVEKTNIKKNNELVLRGVYKYMHSIIGHQTIEQIDQRIGKK